MPLARKVFSGGVGNDSGWLLHRFCWNARQLKDPEGLFRQWLGIPSSFPEMRLGA